MLIRIRQCQICMVEQVCKMWIIIKIINKNNNPTMIIIIIMDTIKIIKIIDKDDWNILKKLSILILIINILKNFYLYKVH
jgi:hypothetical protein